MKNIIWSSFLKNIKVRFGVCKKAFLNIRLFNFKSSHVLLGKILDQFCIPFFAFIIYLELQAVLQSFRRNVAHLVEVRWIFAPSKYLPTILAFPGISLELVKGPHEALKTVQVIIYYGISMSIFPDLYFYSLQFT